MSIVLKMLTIASTPKNELHTYTSHFIMTDQHIYQKYWLKHVDVIPNDLLKLSLNLLRLKIS